MDAERELKEWINKNKSLSNELTSKRYLFLSDYDNSILSTLWKVIDIFGADKEMRA